MILNTGFYWYFPDSIFHSIDYTQQIALQTDIRWVNGRLFSKLSHTESICTNSQIPKTFDGFMYVYLSIENWGNFFVLDNCEAPLRCIIRAFNSTAAEVLKCIKDGGPSFDNPKRKQRTVYLSDCDR